MTYTLYGSKGSGSAAIEVALKICDVSYQKITASTWEPGAALEQLKKVNPLGQIPTLTLPDDTVLTESAAILIHLGLCFPASKLIPVAPELRAQVLRGLVFIASNCYSAISIIDYPDRWTTATTKSAHEKVCEGARKRLYQHWEIFADTFAASPYLSGGEFGALDILAAVVSKWSGARTHLEKKRPDFVEVIHRIEANEAVASVFSEHW